MTMLLITWGSRQCHREMHVLPHILHSEQGHEFSISKTPIFKKKFCYKKRNTLETLIKNLDL